MYQLNYDCCQYFRYIITYITVIVHKKMRIGRINIDFL